MSDGSYSGELTPELWSDMTEAQQAAYRNRNELLWRFIRAVTPGASGHVDDFIEPSLARISEALETIDAIDARTRAFLKKGKP